MNDEIPFWIKFSGNDFPKNAIVGGLYKGERAFIGRAYHNGALTPGTVLESEKICLVPWGFKAHKKHEFEILVGMKRNEGNWVVASNGDAPKNAFIGGMTESQETNYIGRIKHGDNVLIGKVHKRWGVGYFPFDEKEIEKSEYEVFVI